MNSNSQKMSKPTDQQEQVIGSFDRQIIEASPSGMILVDTRAHDMPIIYVNRAFEQLTGYSRDDVIGQNCRFLQGDDRDQPDLDILRTAVQSGSVCTVTLRNYRKDGTFFWNELRVSPIFDDEGQLTHFVGVQNDVTDHIEMQKALRKSEYEFRNLTEKSPDLIARINRDSTHLYVNPAFAAAIGLPAEEIVGKTNIDLGVPEETEQELAAIRDQIYETGKATEMELDYLVGGVLRNFHLLLTPELDLDGRVRTIISVSRDVTARKQAQQHQFELELERERRLLLISFIQNAAHEFRTPLTIINSSAYIMSRSEDAERRVQKAQQVESHVQRITKLIDMLLLMAKLEGSHSLMLAPVDILTVVEELWQVMKEKCSGTYTMQYERSSDRHIVLGNANYLAEALKQIIENACRFTPEGGTITLSVRIVSEQLVIAVHDTGPGIPEDQLPQIFETFWRQDMAHSTPGFGLGLPIAQKIIKEHGGEIIVESTEGKGSEFCIVLPLPVPWAILK